MTSEMAKQLLGKVGKTAPQPLSDWKGKVELPAAVARYYEEIGPVNVTVRLSGNPLVLPRLSDLWKAQRGYGFGLRGEPLDGWPEGWLVVGEGGGDALVFDVATAGVLYASPADEGWDGVPLFTSLNAMAAGLATLASLVKRGANTGEMEASLSSLIGGDGPAPSVILTQLGLKE